MGSIDPLTAAEIAKKFEIRVYTVGVGRNGYAPFPTSTMFGIQYQNMEVKIDEDILKAIANKTGGKYFRATNNKKLAEIYKEIDQLEKSKIELRKFSNKNDEFLPLALIAFILLLIGILLKNFVLKSLP
jgi:Ca-activated chloride channel family protein